MAGPTLSRFLGLFRLRDASDPTRVAAVSATGEVSVAAAQIGEVQVSPTANTALDRLKTLHSDLAALDTKTGSLTETAPASDTASAGLNGRLQRIAQRLTSMIALLPTSLGTGGGLKIEGTASDGAVAVAEPRLTDNGYRQVTGLTTATALTVPANSVSAIIQVDVADVRWRMDGVNPTATVGNLMAIGDRLKFNDAELALLKFIEVDSGAILNIQYEKRP